MTNHRSERRRKRKPKPAELERMLRSREASSALPAATREAIHAKLTSLRQALQRLICSSTWLSDCWNSGEVFPPAADTTPMQPCRCERCSRTGRLWPGIYCAPGRAQRPCHEVHTPAGDTEVEAAHDQAGAAGGKLRHTILSYECYLESLSDWAAAQLPSSPSGMALRAIREGRIKLRRQKTRLGTRRHISGA